jgi:hypothetical protein
MRFFAAMRVVTGASRTLLSLPDSKLVISFSRIKSFTPAGLKE